ncbi:hypothetical protein Bbelb_335730 [Branchiostoma belcheri]|nr:hypothetical protein Bbelb_335730 [Branchiostoma belcheri]
MKKSVQMGPQVHLVIYGETGGMLTPFRSVYAQTVRADSCMELTWHGRAHSRHDDFPHITTRRKELSSPPPRLCKHSTSRRPATSACAQLQLTSDQRAYLVTGSQTAARPLHTAAELTTDGTRREHSPSVPPCGLRDPGRDKRVYCTCTGEHSVLLTVTECLIDK